jgi:integral membrane sensor domain MASE1
MNLPFVIGFLLFPAVAAATGAATELVSTKQAWFIFLLAGATVAPAVAGFSMGRNANPFSSVPISSWWRSAVTGALGLASALVGIPIGFWIYVHLAHTGIWQTLVAGSWFLIFGMVVGYGYGPLFRLASKLMPFLRNGERVV